jgi:hypothetical protein
MTDLDTKLREIAEKHGVSSKHYPSGAHCRCIEGPMGHFVHEVYDAFEEAGWMSEEKSWFKKGWDSGYHTAEIEYKAIGYVGKEARLDVMTGQEWYERFAGELPVPDENGAVGWSDILAAAKRATEAKE